MARARWCWCFVLGVWGFLACGPGEPAKPAVTPPPSQNATAALTPANAPPSSPEQDATRRELAVGYLLQGAKSPDRLPGEDLDGDGQPDMDRRVFDTHIRGRLLAHARELAIGFSPTVALAAADRLFAGGGGPSHATTHQQFTAKVLSTHRLDGEDFARFAQAEMAMSHLHQVRAAGGAFLPSRVARRLFEFDHEQFYMEVTVVAATNHLDQVLVDDVVAAEFYTNHAARYRPPPSLRVVAVRLPFAALDAAAAAPSPEIEESAKAIYRDNGPAAFPDALGKPLAEAQALGRIRATLLAHQRIQKLADQIFVGSLPDVARLREAVRADTGRPALRVEELDGAAGATAPPGLSNTFEAAARLPENRVWPDPVFESDAVCLVALLKRQEASLPPFSALPQNRRLLIMRDCRVDKAWAAAQIRGKALRQIFAARLKQGDRFERMCQDANTTFQALPPFSLLQTQWPALAPLALADAQQAARELTDTRAPHATLTAFEATPSGGRMIHLARRVPVTDANATALLPAYAEGLRQQGISAARAPIVQPAAPARGPQVRPPAWFLPEWEQVRLKMLLDVKLGRQSELKAELNAARQQLVQTAAAIKDTNATISTQTRLQAQLNLHHQTVLRLEEEQAVYQGAQQRLAAETARGGRLDTSPLPPAERDASDRLGQLMQGTNALSGEVLSQWALAHPGTLTAQRAQLMAAAMHFAEGRPQAAERELQSLASRPLPPVAATVQLGLAACLEERGALDEARVAYQRVLAQHPQELEAVQARLALGALHEAAGENAQAATRYAEVMNLDPVGYWGRMAAALESRLPVEKK